MDKIFTTGLAAIRKGKGLTLAGLSHKVGISHPALWNFENGKKSLSEATLVKIAEVLGVPLSSISKQPLASPTKPATDPNTPIDIPGQSELVAEVRSLRAELAEMRRLIESRLLPGDTPMPAALSAARRSLRAAKSSGHRKPPPS